MDWWTGSVLRPRLKAFTCREGPANEASPSTPTPPHTAACYTLLLLLLLLLLMLLLLPLLLLLP